VKKIFWKLTNEDMDSSPILYLCTRRKVEASCLVGANDYHSKVLILLVDEYLETAIDHVMVGLYQVFN
jgi:hypothetical protein